MKMSKEQYENHMRRISGGARAKLQEQQKDSPIRKKVRSNNRSKKEDRHDKDEARLHVEFTFYVSDRRKRDLDGAVSTCLDVLVEAQIIPDDNIYEVSSIWASWERCKKGNEGVKVKILEEKCG